MGPTDLHHRRFAWRCLADRLLRCRPVGSPDERLGNWNILIGMGAMAAAFGIATLWK